MFLSVNPLSIYYTDILPFNLTTATAIWKSQDPVLPSDRVCWFPNRLLLFKKRRSLEEDYRLNWLKFLSVNPLSISYTNILPFNLTAATAIWKSQDPVLPSDRVCWFPNRLLLFKKKRSLEEDYRLNWLKFLSVNPLSISYTNILPFNLTAATAIWKSQDTVLPSYRVCWFPNRLLLFKKKAIVGRG